MKDDYFVGRSLRRIHRFDRAGEYELSMVSPELRLTEFLEVATEAALTQSNFYATEQTIRTIAATSSVDDQWLRDLLARAWEATVLQALEDGVLSQKEEERLLAFKDHFDLPTEPLDRNSAYTRVLKAAVFRDILDGRIPQRVKIDGSLPFNFRRGETLIWLFRNAEYYEPRTYTSYSGG